MALAIVLDLSGCDRDLVAPWIEVTEISPREIEVGDRFELRGSGFPQGRVAHLTFRGALHRPGEKATGASIELDAVVMSSERIEAAFTDAFEERFCGRGDAALHTTFRGEVELAFASTTPGAPPLVGVLRGVLLDVRPPALRSDQQSARAKEGARVLAFLGINDGMNAGITANEPAPRGLPIQGVRPGSPADRAGIQVGDVLAEVDGVVVANASDVLPASSRTVTLLVRHADGAGEETKTLPLSGYASERIPIEYGPAIVIVWLALASLVLLVVPLPALLSAAELRVASRLRRTSAEALVHAVTGKGASAIAYFLALIFVGTFALGSYVISAELDGAMLLVITMGLLATARATAKSGNFKALRAAIGALGACLALALPFAGMIALEGALSLGELVRSQGALPWEFSAAREPAALVLATAYFGALGWLIHQRSEEPTDTRAYAVERVGVLLACALGAAVFFGGWQLPDAMGSHQLATKLAGALLFLVKSCTIQWLIVMTAPLDREQNKFVGAPFMAPNREGAMNRPPTTSKRLVSLSGLGFALVALSRHTTQTSASFRMAWGIAVIFSITLLTARFAFRVRRSMLRPLPSASPDAILVDQINAGMEAAQTN
ncbi:MAG: PDZ domain-containing protein [Polyangiaceae bacterium]|nr:PDZ domain-containing protein [Polyangiaceae bacterium]